MSPTKSTLEKDLSLIGFCVSEDEYKELQKNDDSLSFSDDDE